MFKNINTASLSFVVTLGLSLPAVAEEAHEGGGGLPQFDPTSWPSQIFWLAVFFTVLYVVFGKSVIPTLGNTIEARTSYIADNIRKAEILSAEAEALRVEIDKAMKSAGQTASTAIAEADTAGKAKLATALADFRARYEQQVATTEQNIISATAAAMTDMEQIAATLAAQAAEKIAGIPASESGAEGVVKSLSQKTKLAA